MSIKLILGIVAVLAICTYIFKKTVSNDAENDYRLRDILANTGSKEEEDEKLTLNLKSSYNEKALEENVYEELEKEKNDKTVAVIEQEEEKIQQATEPQKSYSTTTHDSYHIPNYNQEVYYEKVNDDACENYSAEDEEPAEEEEKYLSEKTVTVKKSMGLFDYVKTFWKGVTFTIGAILFLYAVYGLMNLTQTPEEAIKYSIWLLAGIILVK